MAGAVDFDAEVLAMGQIAKVLDDLEEDQRGRVLKWAADRFSLSLRVDKGRSGKERLDDGDESEQASHEDFPEFFDACGATTDTERALVAGYWLGERQEQKDFDSQSANTLLKNLGRPIGNITRAYDNLISQNPRPVMQVRKAGSSKQARKQYRITAEGKKRVDEMLKGKGDE